MRLAVLSLISAVFGLASANASTLQFSAMTSTDETVTFTLNTAVPNTYSPTLYPGPIRGVYLNAVQDLNFEGTHIAMSDVVTSPAMAGDGRPLTVMDVGPLFDTESLSIELIFLDPTLVTPLNSDPSAYERSFAPLPLSVLFPATPPPRTHVDPLLTLTVSEVPEPSAVPEPSYAVAIAVIALCTIALRRSGVRANQDISHF